MPVVEVVVDVAVVDAAEGSVIAVAVTLKPWICPKKRPRVACLPATDAVFGEILMMPLPVEEKELAVDLVVAVAMFAVIEKPGCCTPQMSTS